MAVATPLSYNISNWKQLSQCKSNNSQDLYITVSSFINNDSLTGTLIHVKHKLYGTLFSYMVDAEGECVTDNENSLNTELSTQTILDELYRYGFIVTYNQKANLPTSQLEYLKSIKSLGFQKLRILSVKSTSSNKTVIKDYVVGFNIEHCSNWLNNTYIATDSEFTNATKNNYAYNFTMISKENIWSWSWLDYVANIDDILSDNNYTE